MDSPHGNYPLLKASSVGVSCPVYGRNLINDSVYFLQYQSPFKGDAMTVGEISCYVPELLVMQANSKGSFVFPHLVVNKSVYILEFTSKICYTNIKGSLSSVQNIFAENCEKVIVYCMLQF